jgi:hypothetical protein
MKKSQILLVALLFSAVIAFAFTSRYKSDKKGTAATTGFALVELYTSEGCSSCPPADKLLAKIQQEYKGKEVYVLAYHVDYWNRLGWKDVFSSPAYSARQRTYAGYLKASDGVYTPQAIVNGQTEFVGSEDGKMHTVIQQTLSKTTGISLTLNGVKINGAKASLQYQLNGAGKGNSLMLAVIQNHATTKVQAGENGGRTLPHVNIVQKLETIALKNNEGNAEITLPDGFNAKEWGIIAFVQANSNGEILAAQKVALEGAAMASIK